MYCPRAVQLCSVFVDFPKCEMLLEEMVCVVSCNPGEGEHTEPTV